jgi:hypothetical protein
MFSISNDYHQAYASGASPPGPGQIWFNLAVTSSESFTSSDNRLELNCSIVLGPIIGEVTTGFLKKPGQGYV